MIAQLVALSLVAASPHPPATRPPPLAEPPPAKCPDARLRRADRGVPARPRRLGELPPGRLELTVWRRIAGCPIPAVLREGIPP